MIDIDSLRFPCRFLVALCALTPEVSSAKAVSSTFDMGPAVPGMPATNQPCARLRAGLPTSQSQRDVRRRPPNQRGVKSEPEFEQSSSLGERVACGSERLRALGLGALGEICQFSPNLVPDVPGF